MLSFYHVHPFWRFGSVGALIFYWILPKACAQQSILFKVNPQPDHYFFAPSGLRAEEGQRTFQNISLAFFQSNRMKSRGRSVGWGFVPTFILGDNTDIPIWLNVAKRWETPNPKINTWVGGVFVTLPDQNDGWVFHSGITFGSKEKNVSIGVFAGSMDKDSKPFKGMMMNGQVRLGQRSWLICENYILPLQRGPTPVCLWGYRKRRGQWAFEWGVGWTRITRYNAETPYNSSQYIPFPWVSVAIGLPKLPKLLNNME